ncbi:hypothetical protein [Neoroseomonas oryzicola]|uniref:Uncharacterized protein n=1 Tax=Neoroseomonas oryzicola TaxID=535904 RepID=A0A9X9WLX0_9PROT|nr:hypothetical protein [Neoroseomonas oryzicola]MBR0661330.1 hypothetical protein [Neoroseomonas oryzicola]NKE18820.1 hypothetical protein [Neoroseomonas oryzicola]
MSAQVDLSNREARFLAGIRQMPPSLVAALVNAMTRRVGGEPWQTAIPAAFRDTGWSDADAAPEIALMTECLDCAAGTQPIQ